MVSVHLASMILAVAGLGDPVLLDFNAPWCGPCRSMEPVVAELAAAGYPVRKVDVDREPRLAAQYGVQSIPCFILVSNGKVVDRIVGTADVSQLRAMFSKAADDIGADTKIARGQSPDPPLRRMLNGLRPRNMANAIRGTRPQTIQPTRSPDPFLGRAEQSPPLAAPSQPAAQPQPRAAEKLVEASVRLTIEDQAGFSYGSGTIIDARKGEALVLTCGHIFRDSKGKGKVSVDLFSPSGGKKLPGRIIGYDLKRDVGLVSIRPTEAVTVARLAPKDYQIAKGDRVISVGCNNGADPTAVESQVTSLNKFLGPSNLQVAGQPVQGRSGGGLFSAEGLVVGVCNAADPADNEGLFAALDTIREELAAARLSAIVDGPAPRAVEPAARVSGPQLADAPPAMARQMPSGDIPQPKLVPVPTDMRVNAPGRPSPDLTSAEQSTLAELRQKAAGAEVICIVRSLNSPSNKSEIIVLDRASSGFLKQLAAEQRVQPSANLTALNMPHPGSDQYGRAQSGGAQTGSARALPVSTSSSAGGLR